MVEENKVVTKSNKEYIELLSTVKENIRKSQYEALKAVNKELINMYWNIGAIIVKYQEQYGWGKSVVENLAKDLQNEYPGIQGFSARNMWDMRALYVQYKDNQKLQPLVAEISWTKNIVILQKCNDDLEREYYIRMTKKFGWTKNVLIHQLETKSYEKWLLNQTNFDNTLAEKYQDQAKIAVKDEYTFDFLELGEDYKEKDLESGLINNIRKFLVEMGSYYTFIGNQYRIEINDNEYFIDLLLYHRKLKSLIAIELKVGEFKPEYVGKMQFYLAILNDVVKLEDENPSIGIIICKSKDRTVVEYALKDATKPIGIATYESKANLPEEYKEYLPSPEEIAEKLYFMQDTETI